MSPLDTQLLDEPWRYSTVTRHVVTTSHSSVVAPRPLSAEPATRTTTDPEVLEPALTLDTAMVLFGGTILGSVLAAVILPTFLPDLTASVLGDQPKAFWYLSRSTGVMAYLALWLSAVLGLTLTNRFARLWAGGPAVADIHQFTSLLALALALFHVGILLGDRYTGYRLDQLLVPFTATPHEPFWVGLGQLAFYLVLPVTFSFYARRTIGVHIWRLIHYASFAVYALVLAHGLGAGTDSGSTLMWSLYLVTGGFFIFLTSYRVLTAASRRVGRRAWLSR